MVFPVDDLIEVIETASILDNLSSVVGSQQGGPLGMWALDNLDQASCRISNTFFTNDLFFRSQVFCWTLAFMYRQDLWLPIQESLVVCSQRTPGSQELSGNNLTGIYCNMKLIDHPYECCLKGSTW